MWLNNNLWCCRWQANVVCSCWWWRFQGWRRQQQQKRGYNNDNVAIDFKANEWLSSARPSQAQTPAASSSLSSIFLPARMLQLCNFAYYSHDGFRFASFCRFVCGLLATSWMSNVERRSLKSECWNLKSCIVERCSGPRNVDKAGSSWICSLIDRLIWSASPIPPSLSAAKSAKFQWLLQIIHHVHPSDSIHKSINSTPNESQYCPLPLTDLQAAGGQNYPFFMYMYVYYIYTNPQIHVRLWSGSACGWRQWPALFALAQISNHFVNTHGKIYLTANKVFETFPNIFMYETT